MSDEITDTTPDPSEVAERAFTKARNGLELFGKAVQLPTPSRKIAAQCMGKKHPALTQEDTEAFFATGAYPGMLKDIIIVLWLATTKHASELTADEVRVGMWTVEAASRRPEAAYRQAEQWASDCGIVEMSSEAFQEAFKVFLEMLTTEQAAAYKIKVEGATGGEPENLT